MKTVRGRPSHAIGKWMVWAGGHVYDYDTLAEAQTKLLEIPGAVLLVTVPQNKILETVQVLGR